MQHSNRKDNGNMKEKKIIVSLMNFSFIYTLFYMNYVVESTIFPTKLERKGEELVLKPVELIDLILEEQQRPGMTSAEQHRESDRRMRYKKYLKEKVTDSTNIPSEQHVSVAARKVWSRWSKWGECSATCGDGTKTRRRLCLAGRCAPGEREEQCRPCHRQPCESS